MKKTILSFLLVGSAGLVMAQQQPATSNPDRNKINNNGNPNNRLNNTPNSSLNNGNNNLNNTQANPNTTNPQNVNQPQNQASDPYTTGDTTMRTDPDAQPFNNNMEQNATMNNNAAPMMNNTTSTTYELNVPASIKTSFSTSYPAVTISSWYQSGDWYVARYVENGQISQVSYREDGTVRNAVMSPIRKSFVPDEIVSQAIQKYGANLYAIGSSKGSDEQDLYNVTLIENGQSRTEWMNMDGSTADNHFRTADEAKMDMNRQSTDVQEQGEVTIEDSTMNQPVVTDSTSLNDQTPEPQPQQPGEQDEDHEHGSNGANQEGINNASEINASARRQ